MQRRIETDWILIDPRLSEVEQRCRLAHELVHLERGSSLRCSGQQRDGVLVPQEELRVDRTVADWLVPAQHLVPLIRQLVRSGTGVDATIVCEEFLVTRPIAKLALQRELVEQIASGF